MYHATAHTFGMTRAIKMIENYLGKAFLDAQQMMIVNGPPQPVLPIRKRSDRIRRESGHADSPSPLCLALPPPALPLAFTPPRAGRPLAANVKAAARVGGCPRETDPFFTLLLLLLAT